MADFNPGVPPKKLNRATKSQKTFKEKKIKYQLNPQPVDEKDEK